MMTSFVFRVRNIPAALYKAMGGFATNGVNMTKLESYMVGGEFTATQFYAEIEGHPDDRQRRNWRWKSWAISPTICWSWVFTRPPQDGTKKQQARSIHRPIIARAGNRPRPSSA